MIGFLVVEMHEGRGLEGLRADLRCLVLPGTPRAPEDFVLLDERSGAVTVVGLTIGIPALLGAVATLVQGADHAHVLVWTTVVAFAVVFADTTVRWFDARKRSEGRWPYGLYRVGDELLWYGRGGHWLHAPLALVRIGEHRYSREQGPQGVTPCLLVPLPDGESFRRIDLGIEGVADERADRVARWLGLPRSPVRSGRV